MGSNTTNAYFYKPSLGASGATELALFDAKLDVADAAIKANLDAFATKQPLDAGLTSIAALTTAANKMIYTTALDTYAVASLTAFARSILDDADEATFKATVNLEIGTDVQAYSANNAYRTDKLSAFAATTSAELAGVISNETGTGALVFADTPTLVTPVLGAAAATSVNFGDTSLDYYKEGTWTPAIKFGGNSVDIAYTKQTGLYTKIGRQVTLTAYITLSSKGTSNGDATITALPFTNKDVDGAYTAVAMRLSKIDFANAFEGGIYKNTTVIVLNEILEDGTVTAITDADFAATSSIMLSATYFV